MWKVEHLSVLETQIFTLHTILIQRQREISYISKINGSLPRQLFSTYVRMQIASSLGFFATQIRIVIGNELIITWGVLCWENPKTDL